MRGPFSTPITPLPGSFFHADPQTLAARALAETRMSRSENRKLRGWLLQQDKRLRTAPPDASGSLFADIAAVERLTTDGGPVAHEKHLWAERATSSLSEQT